MTPKELGDIIRNYRNRINDKRKEEGFPPYTQADIAQKIGISKKALGDWERGTAQPKTTHLITLCELFEVSIDEFLGVKKNAFCI